MNRMTVKKIKIGKKAIEGVVVPLLSKRFVMLRGEKGYVMCGYLNLSAANRFNDAAIKITGVASIEDALKAKVFACTRAARKLGIYKGQPVKKALTIIA